MCTILHWWWVHKGRNGVTFYSARLETSMCALLGNPLEEFFVLQSSWLTSYAQCRMVLGFFQYVLFLWCTISFVSIFLTTMVSFVRLCQKNLRLFYPLNLWKEVITFSTLIRFLSFSSNAMLLRAPNSIFFVRKDALWILL